MKPLFISIKTTNDAFADGNRDYEVARILRDVADRIEREGVPDDFPYQLRDLNGASVGLATTERRAK